MSRKMRRPYIPIHKMQLRLAMGILFFMILAALVGGYTVFYTAWSMLGEKLSNVYPQGQLMVIFRDVNWVLARNILIAVPFIVVFSFVATQRIAGPVMRICNTLNRIAEGDYSLKIKLRKRDEFQDVAEAINQLTDRLQEHR